MFILSSVSSGLKFWSKSHGQYFKIMKILGEISDNWPNDLSVTNAYKALEYSW